MLNVSIAGGSGYVGGELMRLIDGHPTLTLKSVSSERLAGRFLHQQHPHLRSGEPRKFVKMEDIDKGDILILALPHGEAVKNIDLFTGLAERVIDCSADFRLDSPDVYKEYYGHDHVAPDWLQRFRYGLPESNRKYVRDARYVSGVGCNATATNLALLPLIRAGIVTPTTHVVADIKAGSSESGKSATTSGQHAERAQVMRSYAPTGHRHAAEVEQVTGLNNVHMSITAVDAVRGAMATVHTLVDLDLDERSLWGIYRDFVADEPFVRIVHERGGAHRHPDPKTLLGTNFADIGWSYDKNKGRLVALAAIDNLMKGAAGSAIQSLNLMCGFEEDAGLGFTGIWPH